MPSDPLSNAVETFAAPIEDLIVALGQGIAKAQQSLDQNSIQMQESIDADPVLSQYGLQATWYQFPTVTMQLKMSLSVAQDQAPAASLKLPILSSAVRTRLVAQPLSAAFQSQFNYDAQAATQVNLTLVPVPPPRSGNQVTSPPIMTAATVQTAALASLAPFGTTTDANGTKIPATTDATGNALTLSINFNASARLWYVIQYAPSNPSVSAVVVAVDDGTGSVRVISSS